MDIDVELRLLLEGIYLTYQHDFRQYAVASLRRRVRQAMVQFGCRTVSQLQERVLRARFEVETAPGGADGEPETAGAVRRRGAPPAGGRDRRTAQDRGRSPAAHCPSGCWSRQ